MFMKIQTLESVLSLCDHLSVCVACACVSAYAWKHARHVSMLSPFAHAKRLSAESSETGIGLTLGRLYFQSNAKLNAYVMLNATEYKRFVTHGLPAGHFRGETKDSHEDFGETPLERQQTIHQLPILIAHQKVLEASEIQQ